VVPDTRKALRPDALKPVNAPEELGVEEDGEGRPQALKSRPRQPVADVEDAWRLDDEWWRAAPLRRCYFAVALSSGQRLTLFKDLETNRWYRQSY
jgi:hypothetical protein